MDGEVPCSSRRRGREILAFHRAIDWGQGHGSASDDRLLILLQVSDSLGAIVQKVTGGRRTKIARGLQVLAWSLMPLRLRLCPDRELQFTRDASTR